MDQRKRIECSLQERIDFLRSLEDESSILRLRDDHTVTMKAVTDALQLARHPRDIHRFLKCIGSVEDIVEIYIAKGREARRLLITSLVDMFIDLLTCGQNPLCSKMELSRVLNVILEGCSLKVSQELLKRDNFTTKIEKLFSQISSSGDFELQVMLIENILRLTPQKALRKNCLHKSIPDPFLLSSFLNIRDSHFDVDCRMFLNKYNGKTNSSGNRIYSFPAENVKLDGEQIYKPDDEGYDDFWIDFNTGSKRISLFCQSTLLPSQLSQNKEPRWETLSLRASDVHRYNYDVKNKSWVVTVELKVNAQMLTNKESENQPHLFMCHFSQCYDVQTALDATLKLKKQKASVPQSLFLHPRKDSSVVQEKPNQIIEKLSKCTKTSFQSHSDLPSSLRSDSSQRKCSAPIEPLNIIASSISSTDGSRHIPWQAIHDRINQKKSMTQCNESVLKPNCTEFIQSCEARQLKNTPKCSVVKVPTEIRFRCDVMEASDLSEMKTKSDNESKFDNQFKNCSEKRKSTTSDTVHQSPVTASGDYVCPVNKSRIPKSAGKNSTQNVQKKTDLIVPECQRSLKEGVPLKNATRFSKLSAEACGIGEKSSTKNTAKVTKTSSRQDSNPSSRKSSLRSGKRIMTPVIELKPLNSKAKQKCMLQNDTSQKIPVNPIENELTGKRKEAKDNNVGLVADDNGFSMVPNRIVDCRTPSDAPILHKDDATCGPFDDFKAPKTFDISKNQGKSRKNRNEIKISSVNQGSIDLMTEPAKDSKICVFKLPIKPADKSNYDNVKVLHKEKLSKPGDNKMISDPKHPKRHFDPLSDNALIPNAVGQNDCDAVTESSGSFELYIEIDKSGTTDEPRNLNQDFVCETQFDKSPDIEEDKEIQGYLSTVTGNWSQSQDLNSDRMNGETCENLNSLKQLKLSNDTQASNSVIGSYVFRKSDNDKVKKVERFKQIDDPTKDCTTLKTKCNKKDTNNRGHEPIDSLKVKGNTSFTKQETDKIEQVQDFMSISLMEENHKSKLATQKKKEIFSKRKATCKEKTKAIPESSPTVTSSNDVIQKSHDNSGDSNSNPEQDLNCRKNLRARNKDICYAECDSVNESSVKFIEKDESIYPKKSSRRNTESKIDNDSFSAPNFMGTISSSKSTKHNHHNHVNEMPSLNGSSQRYRIWKSQEIKTTVTAMPLKDSFTDPYDFDSESRTTLLETSTCIPYKSLEVHNNHISATFKPSQKDKHRKSKNLSESTQHFKNKTYSTLSNISTKVEFKEHIWKSNKVKDKRRISELRTGNGNPNIKKSSKWSFNHSKSDGYTRLSPGKEVVKDSKSSHLKEDDAPNCSDGGLVFPHLEDSIPCTPYSYHEDEDDENSLDTKSRGTEISWIGKVNTTQLQRKKMRGKTYSHNDKICNDNSGIRASLFTNKSHTHSEYEGSETNDKHPHHTEKCNSSKSSSRMNSKKSFGNTFDDFNPSPSPDSSESCGRRKDQRGKEKKQTSLALKSILDTKQKTPKQKLSFEVILKKDKRNKSFQQSKADNMSSLGYSFGSSYYPRSELSSETEYTRDILPEIILEKDSTLVEGIESVVSGPSSFHRLNESALKRKYLSVSSDSVLDLSSDSPPQANGSKRFLPRKLFDSETRLVKTPKRRKRNEIMCLNNAVKQFGDNSPSVDESKPHPKSSRFSCDGGSSEEAFDNLKFKSVQMIKPQKKIKAATISLKEKNILKSPKTTDETSDRENETISSPEIARSSVKSGRKSFGAEKTPSNLDFGFSCGLQPFNIMINSPVALSSQELSKMNSPLKDNDDKPENCVPDDEQNMDAIEMDNEENASSYSGLTALIQMGRANSAAPSQTSSVSDAAQQILKSTNRIMKSSWTEGKGKRSKATAEFDRCLRSVIHKAERFSKEMKEAELKTMLLFSQQAQKLKAHREFSEQSLESLKFACGDLVNEVQESHTNQDRVKKSVKSALKKDFDALAFGVTTKFNEQSLEAMRRCLQASFML